MYCTFNFNQSECSDSCFSQSEGTGEDTLQLIQVAFSVLNRLLMLRTHNELSPVETALSSQPAGYQNQHIVAVIAGVYPFHMNSLP